MVQATEANNAGNRGRQKLNFDEQWYFHRGDIQIPYAVKAGRTGGYTDCEKPEHGEWLEIAYSDAFAEEEMDAAAWEPVTLPHDWAIFESYDRHHKKGRAHLPIGIGCYRKLFRLPAEDIGKRILLCFDGIMRNSTVWVNGHLIGTHASGYTSFHYDVTDVLRYGDEGGNVVFVRVDASEYEGWWYDGCGIYRHAWLLKKDPLHVKEWGTYVTTPQVSLEEAQVRIETTIANGYRDASECRIVTAVIDPAGKTAASAAQAVVIEGDSALTVAQAIPIPEPMLWHPDHPHLYQAISTVYRGGTETDRYVTVFGIRTIRFTSDEGFFLNGEPLLIKGVCVHQDFAGVGSALPDRVHEYKIELLKEMGANAYRSAHHPPAPELLEACDRLGFLVVDENRKLDSSPEGIASLERMLYRDRNHPSIIIWSMENEEVMEGTNPGARILDTLARTTRRIDPTRPVMAAMNHGFHHEAYAGAVDIVGYNYGTYDNDRDIRDHGSYPERMMIGSESASYTTTRGIYEDLEEKAYCSEYGTKLASWCVSPERVLRNLAEHRFLTGTFIWTGFDYKGEPTPYNWPAIGSHFGIMDSCGFPKHNYHLYRSAWRDEPHVHLMPHWTWNGKEGEVIDVWVYSNCEEVELLLNGQSLGVQAADRYSHLSWKVPYAAGTITAVGRTAGSKAAEHAVSTAGPASRIVLAPDRSVIRPDNGDVAMIRVSVCDAEGIVVPDAAQEIRFAVEGEGVLIGVGNGDPSSHESDKASYRRAFNGHCLAIVQTNGQSGSFTIRARADGLQAGEVTIDVR